MKKAAMIFSVVMGCIMITAGLAQAVPSEPSSCSNCHPQDSLVKLTVNDGCLADRTKVINIYTSNTYPGNEGWAIFDPLVNIQNGLGGAATVLMPSSDKTYQIFGVSTYGSASTSMGGSNYVHISGYCPPSTCIDNDNDTYSVSGRPCGLVDCNDADPTIHPWAVEIVRDGIDQDCNGYDLTIVVLKASYNNKTKKLTVQASSLFGASANLVVDDGYSLGYMIYNKKTGIWSLTVSTSPKPATVTVFGFEGSVIATVQ